MRNRAFFAGLACVCLVTVPAWADSLEDVEKKIIAASEKHKSMVADLSMNMNMEGQGFKMKSETKGTYEFMKKGDKTLYRMEGKSNTVQSMGDQETKMDQTMLTISDGDFSYALMEQMGQKQAFKTKVDPSQSALGSKETFESMRKDNELKLLPDEKVDGKDCYVIQATPKQQANPMGPGKMKFYFDKESGIMVKMVAEGPDGKPMQTLTMTNIKLNTDIKPDRFVFKAPDGVEVMDMTKANPGEEAAPKQP